MFELERLKSVMNSSEKQSTYLTVAKVQTGTVFASSALSIDVPSRGYPCPLSLHLIDVSPWDLGRKLS